MELLQRTRRTAIEPGASPGEHILCETRGLRPIQSMIARDAVIHEDQPGDVLCLCKYPLLHFDSIRYFCTSGQNFRTP